MRAGAILVVCLALQASGQDSESPGQFIDTEPLYIIPDGPGRPSRPQRPTRGARKRDALGNRLVRDATQQVARQPWSGTKTTRVVRVRRDHSLQIAGGKRLRLAEIHIPSVSKLDGPHATYGSLARSYIQGTVTRATCTVDLPRGSTASRGAWPGYVETRSGLLLNEELVRMGFARRVALATPSVYTGRLLQAEEYAKRNTRGFWKDERSAREGSFSPRQDRGP